MKLDSKGVLVILRVTQEIAEERGDQCLCSMCKQTVLENDRDIKTKALCVTCKGRVPQLIVDYVELRDSKYRPRYLAELKKLGTEHMKEHGRAFIKFLKEVGWIKD